MRYTSIFAATVFALASGTALAQTAAPAYTADDVVNHFKASTDLGANRSLCIIGSPSCEAPAPTTAPKAFDMRVQFELNSADLTADTRKLLDAFAEAANRQELRRAKFNIDGHTDGLGGEAFNQDLSIRRAESVVAYLEAKGVPADRLVPRGFGEKDPLDGNPLGDANRRVEATISAID